MSYEFMSSKILCSCRFLKQLSDSSAQEMDTFRTSTGLDLRSKYSYKLFAPSGKPYLIISYRHEYGAFSNLADDILENPLRGDSDLYLYL